MDYSKTVNLPQTDFPMKANLPNREPEMLKKWEEEGVYSQILESRKDSDSYILHDGPPYANGNIHIGHALNKILKDMIIKHKTMMGFKAPYIPGWDCHGLPIELNVTKQSGSKMKDLSKVEFRKKCREYAKKYIDIQLDEFKRLGVFGAYDRPYMTMSDDYETTILDTFGNLFKEGYISRNKKPIYWCPSCATALAEAEVEYEDHNSISIYTKFKAAADSIKFDGVDSNQVSILIWTTTPWTLPANLAVAFHPEFEYSAYKFGTEYYILAKGLLEQFEETSGLTHETEIPLSKENIESLKVQHPFIDRESKVVFGTHVTLEQGTGIVHTAPGHGQEDYAIGLQYGLDIYCPVDDYGKFTKDFPEMQGIKIFEANEKIVELLKDKNSLVYSTTIEHSYPYCWRCKKPLIFRATAQWFLKVDHKDLRKKGLKAIDDTEWVPGWGESRFRSMAENRPDWCLSRQRTWGVPIPSFKCTECEENMMSATSIEHFVNIARSETIDVWFGKDIKDLIPADTKCSCGSTSFKKEEDILDVWFDSGVSHYAVLENSKTWPELRWPADMYLEGSDQHRGWFQSSFWPALALKGRAPYNTVLTHGFVLDEKGKAMSKSQGNVVPPEKLIKQFGADILRLWVSSEDYRNDLRIGMDMVKQIADSYRRIRNTFKFIIGNLADFSGQDILDYEKLEDLDKWILNRLYNLSEEVIKHYEDHEYHLVYRKILNFCAVELSSLYFDVSKDILYIEKAEASVRRSTQTALSEILNTLVRLSAPILAFTAEEVWQFLGKKGSIHMESYYSLPSAYKNSTVANRIDQLVAVKENILKSIELKRTDKVLKSSLEADITIYSDDKNLNSLLSEETTGLKRLFQAAGVILTNEKPENGDEYQNMVIKVAKTSGQKCLRCWNYYETLSSIPEHTEICDRCAAVLTT